LNGEKQKKKEKKKRKKKSFKHLQKSNVKKKQTQNTQIMNHIAITKSMNEYGKKENKIWEERKGCFLCF
jgi:hypothetical protein